MMGNYYRQEDISSALSELMKSPYANAEPFLYSLGAKDCLKLVKNMVDGKVSDSLKIPVADVRENVRGEWVFEKRANQHRCSVCGCDDYGEGQQDGTVWFNHYCPNCGAEMRKNEP